MSNFQIKTLLSRHRKKGISLGTTAMIDIIFLLLIFFLVAAKWQSQEKFLPFDMPTTSRIQAVRPTEPLTIYITQPDDCLVQISHEITIAIGDSDKTGAILSLMSKINQVLRQQWRLVSDPVKLACAEDVTWDNLAKIYNNLCKAGFTDITFASLE